MKIVGYGDTTEGRLRAENATLRAALAEAVGWLESVQQDTHYAFDDDYTPREEPLVPRLKAVLETAP